MEMCFEGSFTYPSEDYVDDAVLAMPYVGVYVEHSQDEKEDEEEDGGG